MTCFFWFFWVYAGFVTFHYQNFWLFLSTCRVLYSFGIKMLIFFGVYAGLVTFPYQNVWLFGVYAGLKDLRFTKPAYTPKKQHVDAKNAQSLHILKKIKSFEIVKSHQTCIYSKKSKKNKNLRLYVEPTSIDDLVFDFFDFFEYMQVLWLFTIKTFDFFWVYAGVVHFCIKCCFFEYMQVWWTSSPSNLHTQKNQKFW